MRIGLDYTPALRQRAGIGRYTRGLFGALLTLDRQNTYALITARDVTPPADHPANAWPVPLPLSERALAIVWQRLRLPVPVETFSGSLDLFHAPNFLLPPLRSRTRALATVHDLSFLVHPECAEPSLVRYLERTAPRTIARANLVLADSEATKADLMRLLGTPADRIAVLYSGADSAFGPVGDPARLQAVRERYGIAGPFLLTVGTLEPRKNLPRLFEAFRLLQARTSSPHHLLVVGGKGWRFEPIFEAAAGSPLGDRIHFLGHLPDPDLAALLSQADLFVYPSLYEGFGFPPLEAMACGAPVACSQTTSLPEVCGPVAAYFDPLDVEAMAATLGDLLADADLRRRLARQGPARAARFTWERSARRLLEIYHQES